MKTPDLFNTADTFNLSGERITDTPAPVAAPVDDTTLTLPAMNTTDTTANLTAEFPHLIACGKYPGAAAVAKNIRLHLRAKFPSVKFSVTCSKGSGQSVRITWTDGPTHREIDHATAAFSAGHFDGMTDCYDYSRTAFNETFGAVKYIFPTREYTDAALARVIADTYAERNWNAPCPTVAEYRNGQAMSIRQTDGHHDLSTLIHRALADLSL